MADDSIDDGRADVVVVGGGVAGLAAAWALRDRAVIVLEASERIGGRVRSDQWEGVPYHLGAQYLAGVTSARLFDELGIHRVRLPTKGGLFLRGRRRTGTALSLMRGLPAGPAGLADVAAVEREAERASRLVAGLVDPAAGPDALPAEATALDEQSFAAALAGRRSTVRSFYGTLIRSLACKGSADLSALYAYAMLGSEGTDGIGGANRARGGMHDVIVAFERGLAGRIRTGARVEAVEQSDDAVEIAYRHGSEERRLAAGVCVVAVPAPAIPQIVAGLPASRLEALRRVRYGRFLAVALFLREPVWEGEWAIACDLPVVSTLLSPAALTGSDTPRVLSSYASADGAAQVWDLPDDEVVRRFVAEIAHVFPRLPDVACGADVRRWDPGYPAWEPGHLALLPELTAPAGRIAFCGDYLSIPSIDGAIVSALRAAADIHAMHV